MRRLFLGSLFSISLPHLHLFPFLINEFNTTDEPDLVRVETDSDCILKRKISKNQIYSSQSRRKQQALLNRGVSLSPEGGKAHEKGSSTGENEREYYISQESAN